MCLKSGFLLISFNYGCIVWGFYMTTFCDVKSLFLQITDRLVGFLVFWIFVQHLTDAGKLSWNFWSAGSMGNDLKGGQWVLVRFYSLLFMAELEAENAWRKLWLLPELWPCPDSVPFSHVDYESRGGSWTSRGDDWLMLFWALFLFNFFPPKLV